MAKVKDISVQIRGVSYKPNDLHDELDDNSVILLRANNIEDDKGNLNDVMYVDKSKVSESQYLQKGDILVCASSDSKNLVEKATIINIDIMATFGAFCKVVRHKNIFPEFLGHYFTSPKYRNTISELSAGTNINNIRNEHIDSLDIIIPPLEIQRQITANLDKLTHTIDLCNAILEKLDLLVKSRFVEMFGEPLTNPMNWEVKRLDEVAYLNKGITYAPEDVSDEGIVVLRSSNIKGNVFDLEDIVKITKSVNSEKYVHKNDILMCNRNGSARLVGKVAKIPELSENMTFGTFMTIVRSDIYEYLFTFFQLDAFREQIKFQTAVAINQISLPLLASVKVPIPPKKLIDQFAAFVEQTDKSKLSVKQVLEKAEALMQEYFG